MLPTDDAKMPLSFLKLPEKKKSLKISLKRQIASKIILQLLVINLI